MTAADSHGPADDTSMASVLPRRALGRAGLTVTELGFGASVIASKDRIVTPEEAIATVEAAWDGGVRYFDTAPHYGLGVSERRLGAALAGHPRDEYVLSTKVGRLLVPNPNPTGQDKRYIVPDDLMRQYDFSADGVRRSLDESLVRLGLDRVDIVYVHDPHDHADQAISDAIPALCRLRDEGVVRAIGLGIGNVVITRRVIAETDVDVIMLPERWTLLDRSGAPILADCAERGVAVVSAAPFNSGLLARPEPAASATVDNRTVTAGELDTARALAVACVAAGTTLPAAAIQFALRRPEIGAVVVGLRNVEQVRAAVRNVAAQLPSALWPELDRIASRKDVA